MKFTFAIRVGSFVCVQCAVPFAFSTMSTAEKSEASLVARITGKNSAGPREHVALRRF
jgi:hypothetical protein